MIIPEQEGLEKVAGVLMLGFATLHRLRANGVIGLNEGNTDYLLRYNQQKLYPLVDGSREVAAEAKAEGYRAGTAATKLRVSDFETLTRRATLRRTINTAAPVTRAALECLERMPLIKKVRLAGMCVSKLEQCPKHPH